MQDRSKYLPNAEISLNRRLDALRNPSSKECQELEIRLQSYKDATVKMHRGKDLVLANKESVVRKTEVNAPSEFALRQEAWKVLCTQRSQAQIDRERMKAGGILQKNDEGSLTSNLHNLSAWQRKNKKKIAAFSWLRIIALYKITRRCAVIHNTNVHNKALFLFQVKIALEVQRKWRQYTAVQRGRAFRHALMLLRRFMHVALFRVRFCLVNQLNYPLSPFHFLPW